MQRFDYPRKEVAYWERSDEKAPGYWKAIGQAELNTTVFCNRVVTCTERRLQLSANGKRVAQLTIEGLPSPNASQAILFSGCGQKIWYFGYERGQPRLFLLDGFDLTVVDRFDPTNHGVFRDPILEFGWGELSLIVDSRFPNQLLAYSNLGDSPFICSVFQFDKSGIRQVNQPGFVHAVETFIDERIHSVRLLSPSTLLVVDDVTQLLLFRLPCQTLLERIHVTTLLEIEEDCPTIWTTSDEDPIIDLGEEFGLVGSQLMVNLLEVDYGRKPSATISAQAVLDLHSLKPIGLIRPPADGIEEVVQVTQNVFRNDKGFWRLTIT